MLYEVITIPGADPIHKVSIIPRGMALGVTQQLPIDERHTYSKEYLKDNITILMGGRVAEELVRGELTTGAGNDIERSTYIARKMVCEWGMSEKLGPVTFGQKQEAIFLGREFGRHQDYSESTVITSYSIHYTKLYDTTRPATRSWRRSSRGRIRSTR